MPPVGFEPTMAAGERQKTYALDRAAPWIGIHTYIYIRTLYVHYIRIYISIVSEIHEFHNHRLITRTLFLHEGLCPFARSSYRVIFLIFSSKSFSKTQGIQLQSGFCKLTAAHSIRFKYYIRPIKVI